MGTFIQQQERMKDARDRQRSGRENLGKFFYDLAKITFTALVVGSVASLVLGDRPVQDVLLIAVGAIATIILALMGYRTIK